MSTQIKEIMIYNRHNDLHNNTEAVSGIMYNWHSYFTNLPHVCISHDIRTAPNIWHQHSLGTL